LPSISPQNQRCGDREEAERQEPIGVDQQHGESADEGRGGRGVKEFAAHEAKLSPTPPARHACRLRRISPGAGDSGAARCYRVRPDLPGHQECPLVGLLEQQTHPIERVPGFRQLQQP
jgi:hypothetical protein